MISDLEIVTNKLNTELLAEESKLALEDSRLREINKVLEKLRNKKEKGLNEFLIGTSILLLILFCHLTISFGYFFYIILVIYLLKVPSFIKVFKIIKNKDTEKLEAVKAEIKERIQDIMFNKRALEQQIWKTEYKIKEMSNEKSVLEDINSCFTDKNVFQRTRVREKITKK